MWVCARVRARARVHVQVRARACVCVCVPVCVCASLANKICIDIIRRMREVRYILRHVESQCGAFDRPGDWLSRCILVRRRVRSA